MRRARFSLRFGTAAVTCCLLLTFNLQWEHVNGIPFKHYGRCKLNNRDGFCISTESCRQSTKDINTADANKCFSAVVPNLICCTTLAQANSVQQKNPVEQSFTDTLPSEYECGSGYKVRIIHGSSTNINEYPWTALLRYTNDDETYMNLCGGTLISNRWILTAAHCVRNARVSSGTKLSQVRLGEWDTRTDEDCQHFKSGPLCAPRHIDLTIADIAIHPNYNNNTLVNDIALLRLVSIVTFTEFVQPICLPVSSHDDDHTYENTIMDIVGWGNTENTTNGNNRKLRASLRVWSQDRCLRVNKDLRGTQLCASSDGNSSSCHGDSGGPLIGWDYSKFGLQRYTIKGIISLGTRDCSTRVVPVIFTKVENYVDWIKQTVSGSSKS